MMKITNYIVEWLVQGGFILLLAVLCGILQPLVEEKKNTARTVQAREAWNFAEQVAQVAVNSLVSSQKDGQEKFEQAVKMVQHVMNANDMELNDKSAETLVQSAYEKSPLTGNADEEVPGK